MSCRCEIVRARWGAFGRWRLVGTNLLLAGALLAVAQGAPADLPFVDKVEEDWELVVQLPEVNTDAPQVTCVISPGGDLFGVYAAFELNHHTQPDYAAGGLQLQLWSAGYPVERSSFSNQSLLQQPSETIRWTQRMRLQEGQLVFDVRDGTSQTWGSFGGWGVLRVAIPTELTTLASHQPSFSADHSGVGYAGNRVTRLALREVRWYSNGVLVASDSTERLVHPQE